MKSQQEEKRYQTNCLDCIFAIYKDNEQTDCAIKRLDHFLERNEAYELQQEEKKSYIITRVCNGYRNHEWNNGVLDTSLVLKEVALTYGIIIDTSNMTKEVADKIFDRIISSNYETSKLTIVLASAVTSKNIHNVLYLFHKFTSVPIKTITMNYVDDSFNLFVRQVMKHDISNNFLYHTVTDINLFDLSILKTINDLITSKMEKLSVIEADKNVFVLTKGFRDYLNTCPSYWMSLDNFIQISKDVGYYKKL
jgi:hypothetical protein